MLRSMKYLFSFLGYLIFIKQFEHLMEMWFLGNRYDMHTITLYNKTTQFASYSVSNQGANVTNVMMMCHLGGLLYTTALLCTLDSTSFLNLSSLLKKKKFFRLLLFYCFNLILKARYHSMPLWRDLIPVTCIIVNIYVQIESMVFVFI